MNEIVRQIIDTTLARYAPASPSYDSYIEVAHELFPDQMSALASGFSRQGFIKWFKDCMRNAANVDESDPCAPTVQLDLMPGLPAPAYLNLSTDSMPRLLRFGDAIGADLRVSIQKRKTKSAQITARAEDLQQKLEWLLANQRSPTETVGEVCARLSGREEAAPMLACEEEEAVSL
jgi:hypothetical protein